MAAGLEHQGPQRLAQLRQPGMGHRLGDHHIVAGSDGERTEDSLERGLALMHEPQLVTDGIAMQSGRLIGMNPGHADIGIAQQHMPAGKRITGRQGLRVEQARLQRLIGQPLCRTAVHRFTAQQIAGGVLMKQQRKIGREPLLAHDLGGIQTAIRFAML